MRVIQRGEGLISDIFLFPGQRLCKLMRIMQREEGLTIDVFISRSDCKADESHGVGRGTFTRHVFISRSETV